jgi:tRNA A37 methylthiotransferase MiaB
MNLSLKNNQKITHETHKHTHTYTYTHNAHTHARTMHTQTHDNSSTHRHAIMHSRARLLAETHTNYACLTTLTSLYPSLVFMFSAPLKETAS